MKGDCVVVIPNYTLYPNGRVNIMVQDLALAVKVNRLRTKGAI